MNQSTLSAVTQQALLEEIFLPPSSQLLTNRFDASSNAATCGGSSCGGGSCLSGKCGGVGL